MGYVGGMTRQPEACFTMLGVEFSAKFNIEKFIEMIISRSLIPDLIQAKADSNEAMRLNIYRIKSQKCNTAEKCVLNFASQWYNYHYYSTCSANYC